MAYLPGKNLFAYSSENKNSTTNKRIDRVFSDDLYYIDTYGEEVTGQLAGNGSYMLKKEKFGWEIIPVENAITFDFDLSLIGLEGLGVDIMAVDENGDRIKIINDIPMSGKVLFKHNPDFYKYLICPVISY